MKSIWVTFVAAEKDKDLVPKSPSSGEEITYFLLTLFLRSHLVACILKTTTSGGPLIVCIFNFLFAVLSLLRASHQTPRCNAAAVSHLI